MRLKKWQVVTLIALAVLCFIVLGIGFAIVLDLQGTQVVMPNAGATPVPVAAHPTVAPVPPTDIPTPTPPVFPTPTPRLPILSRLNLYPGVDPLELVKRAYAYRNKPVCIDQLMVFDVQESSDGTTFMIQSQRSPFPVIGTAFYPGKMPGFVDGAYIIIGGYVLGTESEFGGNSSRPAVLVQRFRWIDLKRNVQSYSDEVDYEDAAGYLIGCGN
jgi:hypothetical protein